MSFALGSLGFLTKFDYGNYRSELREIFHCGLSVSLRLRLEATVMRSQRGNREDGGQDLVHDLIGDFAEDHHTHKPECTRDILNDLVIDRGPNPSRLSYNSSPLFQPSLSACQWANLVTQRCHQSKSLGKPPCPSYPPPPPPTKTP